MKNPFTYSGIKYALLGSGHPLQGKPMVDRANPFSQLGIGKIDHSSLSFDERLVLTNRVFMGKHFDWYVTGEGSKGFIDLLVFPLISRVLLYHSVKPSTPPAVSVCDQIIGYPLEVARRLLSLTLTLVVSPLVLLTHLAYQAKNLVTSSANNQSGLHAEKQDASAEIASLISGSETRSVITGVQVT